MQTEEILKAYIDKHGCHPQKVQELISFSKESKQVTNLKYSEARKILAYSKSKSHKNSRNGRLSIKHKKKKNINKSTSKKKNINKSKSKSPPINIQKTNNKLIAASTTSLTPYIDVIDSSDEKQNIYSKQKHKKKTNKSKSKSKSKSTQNKSKHKYNIGDHIKLTQDREGIIKFIGKVSFTTGIMFGIELLNGTAGKHDGKINNKRYFTAPKQRGIFVKESRIQRKIRHNERSSSFSLNREASIKQKEENAIKKKWIAPFPIIKKDQKDMEFKSEHTYIHNSINNDSIDDSSMSIVYRKASLNLHRHILQKVSNNKKQKYLNTIKDNAFSAHNKLHSPMISIRIAPMSPILTFENISTQTMKSITQKLMSKKKKKKKRKKKRIKTGN
eukprot:440465_1